MTNLLISAHNKTDDDDGVTSDGGNDEKVGKSRRASESNWGGGKHIGGIEAEQNEAGKRINVCQNNMLLLLWKISLWELDKNMDKQVLQQENWLTSVLGVLHHRSKNADFELK